MSALRRLGLYSFALLLVFAANANAGVVLNTFTTPPSGATGGTIGFAYAGNKFVGSTYDGQLYSTDLNGGSQALFATGIGLSLTGPNVEHFVAASAGYVPFPNRDIYVGDYVSGAGVIYQIANNGSSFSTFVSGLSGNVRGILFDTVGTFNHDMLVTTTTGNVYEVNGAGVATVIANVGEDAEGLDIVPLNDTALSPVTGKLLVDSERSGTIRSIDPTTHAVQDLFTNASAEELSVIPIDLLPANNTVEGFYGANYTQNVQKADATFANFGGILGHILVTGETTGQVNTWHYDSGLAAWVSQYQTNFPQQPEDGIFVTTAVINSATPEPATVASALVAIAVGIVAFRRRQTA